VSAGRLAQLRAAPDIGTPPELAWLPVDKLHPDARYQRSLDTKGGQALIKRIAASWRGAEMSGDNVAPAALGSRRSEACARGDLRYCECCGAPFGRPKGIGRPQFAKYRFCSRGCAQRTIGTARGRRGGLAKAAKAKLAPPRPPVKCPGDWRIYWAVRPTRAAGSLTEAKARAGIGDERYVEIADLTTGRHLMRFADKWVETKPAGSPLGGRAA